MVLIYKILLLCVSFTAAVQCFCPNGWERFDDSCYLFADLQRETWDNAMNFCTALNSHLIVIDSDKENTFIVGELRKLHPGTEDQFWTAGTDSKNETMWEWANTGDGFEVSYWYPGEPNQNGGEEDCLTFYTRYHFAWNDEHCNKLEPFICEIEDPRENPGEIIG